ncbi:MAG: hypothetical protein F9K38_09705 [Pseudorhodoplanes sp.]|nr:MAG: hypothetical protein F9K38_09705 [Pseudorhodoplanes sp.]
MEPVNMAIDLSNSPSIQLRAVNKEAGESFRAMRQAVMSAGPLDGRTCELIVLSSLASTGLELSFKVHALKARKAGIDKAALQHAVLVTLGAATVIMRITEALRWLEEVEAEFAHVADEG